MCTWTIKKVGANHNDHIPVSMCTGTIETGSPSLEIASLLHIFSNVGWQIAAEIRWTYRHNCTNEEIQMADNLKIWAQLRVSEWQTLPFIIITASQWQWKTCELISTCSESYNTNDRWNCHKCSEHEWLQHECYVKHDSWINKRDIILRKPE